MRESVLRYIRRHGMMKPGDRVLVAVSGGADSVALLRTLLDLRSELGIVLAVTHFHHGLRGEAADADEHFVTDLSRRLELELYAGRGNVQLHAEVNRTGLEAAGRKQRYDWLTETAMRHRFEVVATAHTSDDQAETVLLKFLRGAGSKGLAGIYPVLLRGPERQVRFVRPLLTTSRAELEAYLTEMGQPWREDETNLDPRFRRNRVRHELLPLLEREYSPNVRQALNEAAEIARAEEIYWEAALEPLLGVYYDPPRRFRLLGFASLDVALQRRLLKRFLEREGIAPSFRHIERLRACALRESWGCELPGGWAAIRNEEHLTLVQPSSENDLPAGYQLALPVPGEVAVNGMLIRALPLPAHLAAEQPPGTLLRADLLPSSLTLRNWRPGDRYQPAHTSSAEKLKRLFAEHKIPAPLRPTWPVALKGTDILWVQGFAVASGSEWRPGDGDAIRIQTMPLRSDAAEGM